MPKPRPTLRTKCAKCGHPYSFHGKRKRHVCSAIGCHAGRDGGPCRGFVEPETEQATALAS